MAKHSFQPFVRDSFFRTNAHSRKRPSFALAGEISQYPHVPPLPRPQFSSDSDTFERDSDSDSDELQYTIKPIIPLKRPQETTAEPNKRIKIWELPNKKPPHKWSEEDQITLLNGLIDFKSQHGKGPYNAYVDMRSFHHYIQKNLKADQLNKWQVTDKVRRLKNKDVVVIMKRNMSLIGCEKMRDLEEKLKKFKDEEDDLRIKREYLITENYEWLRQFGGN
ncbi:hypothetical protein RND71_026278 [Anisodus tanguticus]|uniref:Glabrous enhancer-binding protein-like DBD domain-containing protein n=1 Tax=Anisodus tanguticus TaxID=243964 RepID=A0AAE1VAC6_9SOLA|nr:hypothetical protein RND71_026278 [Anisodus tanguticus]